MKTLVAIWVAVIMSGTGSAVYINHTINELVKQTATPQQTINSDALQPAEHVTGNFTTTYNPQQTTGGNGSDYELQPALGYKVVQ